jgi:spermidine/putrescine transport system substrate-binding protein
VHANHVFYPDQSVIERCALMHDCAAEELIAMWSRVKGDNLSIGMIVFIGVVLALIVVFFVVQIINRRRQRAIQQKKRNKNRK